MADIVSSPPALSPRKRPAPSDESPRRVPLNTKGSQFMMPTPPDTEESSNASSGGSINNDEQNQNRAASPAPTVSTIESTIEVASSNVVPDSRTTTATQSTAPASTSTSGPPPAKRRKLTPSEKLEQAKAKEAKARETAEKKALVEQKKADAAAEKAKKAEEKARKEEEKAEEKARKDEEKRVKDEEKRAKAEETEAKKREKELEKERKEQEKLAKERKQMRLGAFFGGKPSTPAKGIPDGGEDQPRTRRKSLSLEPFDAVADQIKSKSPAKGTPVSAKKSAIIDYKRTFLPFELPPTGVLAPVPDHSEADQERLDHELNDPSIQEKYDLGLVTSYASVNNYFEAERNGTRGFGYPDIEKVVNSLRGISNQPIDLTAELPVESGVEILRRIPIRLIQFEEDVRPAYQGSYTKIRSPKECRKMSRDPSYQGRPDTEYDVDSEAEWEPPEEGDEEILDDDEDEADSQADAGEMDDFLDDEEDVKTKRKLITDSLVPENTGLCWENDRGRVRVVDGVDVHEPPEVLTGMRIGFLLPGFSGMTIDPFSTAYWEKPALVPTMPAVVEMSSATGLMAPPRQPLQPKLNFSGTQPQHDLIGAAEGQKGPITSLAASQAAKRGPKPAPKTLSKEDLEEFKEAVTGSPLGKLELQKGLKSRFPKLTNETIKENLNTLFAQKGAGKAKQWVYVGDS